jgi:hypothetical protein
MIRFLCALAVLFATPALAVPMTTWDAKQNGDPKVYNVSGLSLTLASGKDEDKSTIPTLTIHAPGAPPFKIDGDSAFDDAAASFAVGRFDPKSPAPQVVFASYTGGAHCCSHVLLAERAGAGWQLVDLGLWDGDGMGAAPAGINGAADFVFRDNSFLYTFESYAGSWPPLQILNVVGGKVIDVSAAPRYRKLFAQDMVKAKAQCAQKSNGGCAGYVADAARAGQFDEAWKFMLAHYEAHADWDYPTRCIGAMADDTCKGKELKPRDYPQALRWFLEDHHYITADK